MSKIFYQLSFVALLIVTSVAAAAPQVTIVANADAPPLEKFAVDELAAQLQSLFAADVLRTTQASANSPNVILLGSPKTNPAVAKALGTNWPSLSEQGQIVKTISLNGKPALVVGGGSPVATLWAVYELAQQWGVRSLLYGDVLPAARGEFRLTDLDVKLEPQFKQRAWRLLGMGPTSTVAWGLADQRLLLRQLAKLKFNHVQLAVSASQPFIESTSAKNANGLLLGQRFLLSGDTPGRAAFRGDKEFTNPDFVGKNSSVQQQQAGVALLKGILAAASELGMTAEIVVDGAGDLLAAYRATYPGLPVIAANQSATSATLALSSDELGILPRLPATATQQMLQKLAAAKTPGFIVQATAIADANSTAYFISRRAFDSQVTARSALTELIAAVSGEGIADRVIKGFELIEEANDLMAKHDPSFARPTADMLTKQLADGTPPPAWWKEVQTRYINAMNEMYRGNNRAREGTRRFTLYHAKRFEFALHYMTCVDAARAAGVAKKAGNADLQLEQLEKAVEALYSSLNALAEVTRDQSDRGLIAVLNEFGFRPLKKEFEDAE